MSLGRTSFNDSVNETQAAEQLAKLDEAKINAIKKEDLVVEETVIAF